MITAYRAVLPGAALLCSLVAFALALCCLLAGTSPNTLQNMELYTLNTSKIGPTLMREMHLPDAPASLNFSSLVPRIDVDGALSNANESLTSTASSLESEASDLIKDPAAAIQHIKDNITHAVDQAKQEISDEASKVEGAVKNATQEVVSLAINETIQLLHIQDFYVAHLLVFCEGNYTAKGKQNLTYCSNGKVHTKYNATGQEKEESMDNPLAFLESLHLPDPIDFALHALTFLAKITSAFYFVGIFFILVSIVSAAMTIPGYFRPPTITGGGGKSRLLRYVTLASGVCAFFTLLLATAIVHFLVKRLCELFNKHPGAGIAAYPGQTFQNCSWASVILLGIAMTLALADLAIGIATKGARNKLQGAAGRKWWGRNKKEEKQEQEYEL
ncbi:MAG: hypothetical protein Q9195_007365 [Heterodermia aff. obscurata]